MPALFENPLGFCFVFVQVLLRGTSEESIVVLSCSTLPAVEGVVQLLPRQPDMRPAVVSNSRQLSVGFEVRALPTELESVQIELLVRFTCFQPGHTRQAAARVSGAPSHEYRTVFELPLS